MSSDHDPGLPKEGALAAHGAIAEGVDRTLSQIISAVWLVLVVGLASRDLQGIGEYASWWLLLTGATLVPVFVNLLFGGLLPIGVLRGIWIAVPLVGFVRIALAGIAYGSDSLRAAELWNHEQGPWVLASAFSVYLIFWMRLEGAIAVVLLSSLLPVCSIFLIDGEVPYSAWVNVPLYMALFSFVAIFSVRRELMLRFRTFEAEAHAVEAHRLRAAAEAEQQARFVRLVHDEVLASLSAALRFEGEPPESVREQAARALVVLDSHEPTAAGTAFASTMPCEELRERLTDMALGADPLCRVELRSAGEQVEALPAHTLLAAAGEAMRNSVRHAGHAARRTVRGELSSLALHIEVEDDGDGFAMETIGADRIGVRRSILGAAAEVRGASAEIVSDPGRGTRVVLQWRE